MMSSTPITKLPVFVSFTTIRSRLASLPRMIESLLAQTLRPDRIILNISRDPFLLDQGVAFGDLPRSVRAQAIAGRIEVYFTPNTGPYRKLLPTLRRFCGQSYLVATADDDWAYPPEWLARLHSAVASGATIAAHRCRMMAVKDGRFLAYNAWPEVPPGWARFDQANPEVRNLLLSPVGGYGVMYHSHVFPDHGLLEELRALAPQQDDLALRFATLLSRTPVALVPAEPGEHQEASSVHIGNSRDALFATFNVGGGNDAALGRLVAFCARRFGLDLSAYHV